MNIIIYSINNNSCIFCSFPQFVVLFLVAAANAASIVPAKYESSVVRNDRVGNNFAYSITENKAVGGAVIPDVGVAAANPVEIQSVSVLPVQNVVADTRNIQLQQAEIPVFQQQLVASPVQTQQILTPLRTRVQSQVLVPTVQRIQSQQILQPVTTRVTQQQQIQPQQVQQVVEVPVTRVQSAGLVAPVQQVQDVQNLEIQNVRVTPLNYEQANVKTLNYGVVPSFSYQIQQQPISVLESQQAVPISNLGLYGINYGIRGLSLPYAYSYPYTGSNAQQLSYNIIQAE